MKKIITLFFIMIPICIFSQEKVDEFSLENAKSTTNSEAEEIELSKVLSKMWELKPKYQQGTFRFSEYKPMYIAPFRFTDKPTEQPISLNTENRAIPKHRDYQQVEVKFQVSVKGKIIQDAFWGKGDFWVAFTQQAWWQMYNSDLSRPFRELNYEPELIFTYPISFTIGSFRMRMMGLSLNHQSNGKDEPLSRSWNRGIFLTSFEVGNWIVNARFWKRLPEGDEDDDNPYIEDYVGRCEVEFQYPYRKNLFIANFRNSLNFNKKARGRAEISWTHPISDSFRFTLQAAYGYGDSLVDYNYKQAILGVAFTFLHL